MNNIEKLRASLTPEKYAGLIIEHIGCDGCPMKEECEEMARHNECGITDDECYDFLIEWCNRPAAVPGDVPPR